MTENPTNELLSLLNDHVFRKIFGQLNTDALAEFLSVVLDVPSGELAELQVEDPNLYREREDGKAAELDVRVRTRSGQIIHVEVQVNPVKAFAERIAFQNSRTFPARSTRVSTIRS